MSGTNAVIYRVELNNDQKDIYDYLSKVEGYSSLSEFVVSSLNEKVKTYQNQNEIKINSEDQEKFFHYLFEEEREPNEALRKASLKFNAFLDE